MKLIGKTAGAPDTSGLHAVQTVLLTVLDRAAAAHLRGLLVVHLVASKTQFMRCR
jgi:hypothetical protein